MLPHLQEEAERRARLLELEAAHAAAEKAKPRSKRVRKVKPWQSMGSEVRQGGVRGGRTWPRIRLLLVVLMVVRSATAWG